MQIKQCDLRSEKNKNCGYIQSVPFWKSIARCNGQDPGFSAFNVKDVFKLQYWWKLDQVNDGNSAIIVLISQDCQSGLIGQSGPVGPVQSWCYVFRKYMVYMVLTIRLLRKFNMSRLSLTNIQKVESEAVFCLSRIRKNDMGGTDMRLIGTPNCSIHWLQYNHVNPILNWCMFGHLSSKRILDTDWNICRNTHKNIFRVRPP